MMALVAALLAAPATYPARYQACHDGDTCHFVLTMEDTTRTLGMGMTQRVVTWYEADVRFCNINAPELDTPKGPASRDALTVWLQAAKEVNVMVYGTDKYGRVLGRVFADGADLNQRMLDQGLAVPYLVCK